MNTPDSKPNAEPDFQEDWFSAYLDDELSPEQRRVVQQRLDSDPSARRLVAELEQVRQLVGQLPVWPLGSPDLSSLVLASAADTRTRVEQASRAEFDTETAYVPQEDETYHENLLAGALSSDVQLAKRSDYQPLDGALHTPSARPSRASWAVPLAGAAAVLAMVGIGITLWPSRNYRFLANAPSGQTNPASESQPDLYPAEEMQSGVPSLESLPTEPAGSLPPEPAEPASFADATAEESNIEARAQLPAVSSLSSPESARSAESFGARPPLQPSHSTPLAENSAASEMRVPAERPPADLRRRQLQASAAAELSATETAEASEAPANPAKTISPSANRLPDLSARQELMPRQQAGGLPKPSANLRIGYSSAWSVEAIADALGELKPVLGSQAVSEIDRALMRDKPTTSRSSIEPETARRRAPLILLSVEFPHDDEQWFRNLLDSASGRLTRLELDAVFDLRQENAQSGGLPSSAKSRSLAGPANSSQMPSRQEKSSIALFLSRSESEAMLRQVASAQATASPVWITNGDSAEEVAPDQQVILLLSPRE